MAPIHVDRDGGWAWRGEPLVHDGILLYLKQHLQRDRDGSYWVTVDSARVPVVVEDAPFVVATLLSSPPRMRLDDEREIPLPEPLELFTSGEHRLYVAAGSERALLSRQAHHQVWNGIEEDPDGSLRLLLGTDRLTVVLTGT